MFALHGVAVYRLTNAAAPGVVPFLASVSATNQMLRALGQVLINRPGFRQIRSKLRPKNWRDADFSSAIRVRWLAVTRQNPEPPPDRGSARSEAWRRLRSGKVPAETKLPIALKSQ
jgi:hypothetical protein